MRLFLSVEHSLQVSNLRFRQLFFLNEVSQHRFKGTIKHPVEERIAVGSHAGFLGHARTILIDAPLFLKGKRPFLEEPVEESSDRFWIPVLLFGDRIYDLLRCKRGTVLPDNEHYFPFGIGNSGNRFHGFISDYRCKLRMVFTSVIQSLQGNVQ